MEDIFNSPAVASVRRKIRDAMFERGEWTTLSLDATCKVCFRLQGQAHYRAPIEVRALAAFPDDASKRKVLTVRGRTGLVILMAPMKDEKDSTIVDTLQGAVDRDCLAQVRFVFSDDPSTILVKQLKTIMPALEAVCLDTTHLPMVYEYATWRRCCVFHKWSHCGIDCRVGGFGDHESYK